MPRPNLPTSHAVDVAVDFVPSSYFVRYVPVPGQPGRLRAVPQRRVDCPHCSEEMIPQDDGEGTAFRGCPSGCCDTYAEALERRSSRCANGAL